jgi:hypothetical protein
VPKDDVGSETSEEVNNYGQRSQEFAGANTTVNTTGTTGTGNVTVKTYDYSLPPDANTTLSAGTGDRALKYIDVKIGGSTYTGNVLITLSYTDDEVTAMGVEESSLRLYYWYNDEWVLSYNSSVDTGNNIITGTIPASKLTGTPVAGAGTAEVTGSFQVGAPPVVTVTFEPTAIAPLVENQATVNVSIANGSLNDLDKLELKLYYDISPTNVT